MKIKFINTLILFLSILISQNSYSQNTRGLYVDRFDLILGSQEDELKLFEYAIAFNFNSFTLYSFSKINLDNEINTVNLKSFISRAKTKYNIENIGIVSENVNRLRDQIHKYNLDPGTSIDEKIDIYNLEFEFWSEINTANYYCEKYLAPVGLACNPEGALVFVKNSLQQMNVMAQEIPGVEVEIYLGWIDENESQQIANLIDRALVAVYKKEEEDGTINLYNYLTQRNRLKWLSVNNNINIVPIFATHDENYTDNILNWLISGGSISDAWNNYYTSYLSDTEPWTDNINIEGYQWFKYSTMPEIQLNGNLDAIVGPSEVFINESHFYSISEIPETLIYMWSNFQGAQIISSVDPGNIIEIKFDSIVSDTLSVYAIRNGSKTTLSKQAIKITEKSSSVINSYDTQEIIISQANSFINLTFPDIISSSGIIRIFSLSGKQLYYFDNRRKNMLYHEINLSGFNTGIYLISILYENGLFQKRLYYNE